VVCGGGGVSVLLINFIYLSDTHGVVNARINEYLCKIFISFYSVNQILFAITTVLFQTHPLPTPIKHKCMIGTARKH
jgi:hypothetical protein